MPNKQQNGPTPSLENQRIPGFLDDNDETLTREEKTILSHAEHLEKANVSTPSEPSAESDEQTKATAVMLWSVLCDTRSKCGLPPPPEWQESLFVQSLCRLIVKYNLSADFGPEIGLITVAVMQVKDFATVYRQKKTESEDHPTAGESESVVDESIRPS